MSKYDDSSSSSDDEQNEMLLSACDPSFSNAWSKPKRNTFSTDKMNEVPLENTGDSDLDSALKQIQRNIYNSDDSFKEVTVRPNGTTLFIRTATGYVPQPANGSSSVKSQSIPYLKRKFDEIISSQVCEKDFGTIVEVNEEIPENSKDDVLQLLPSVVVKKGSQKLKQTRKDHEEWLKKLRKETYIDESTIEDRCKEVAISGEFIRNGGLKSQYAEHRNCNERKVERVKLLKVTRDFILHVETEEQARKRIFLTNKNKKVKSTNSAKKTKISDVKASDSPKGIASDYPKKWISTDSPKGISSDSPNGIATDYPNGIVADSKKKNKRSRKRGGKKKKEVTDGQEERM